MARMPVTGWNQAANQTMFRLFSHLPEGNINMFVRAVWRIKRLVDIKQTLREMEVPSSRNADLLGISGPDFSKMTRSLFDRQS